ncbi:MAG: zinc-ribbon domain-containing protein [Alkalilacustris sp.]
MRIICITCAAQYEVDDNAIPPDGREVQCSACGTAWIFRPPTLSEPEARPDSAAAAVPGRRVDPEVLAVLRAEADREVRARRAEAGILSTQPELGLGPEPPRRRLPPAPAFMATAAAGETATSMQPTPEAPLQRRRPGRERLPAIEDIDPEPPEDLVTEPLPLAAAQDLGSLSSAPLPASPSDIVAVDAPHHASEPTQKDPVDQEPGVAAASERRQARGGRAFLLGFAGILVISLAASALYLEARASQNPPATLAAYAGMVDRVREVFDTAITQLGHEIEALIDGR